MSVGVVDAEYIVHHNRPTLGAVDHFKVRYNSINVFDTPFGHLFLFNQLLMLVDAEKIVTTTKQDSGNSSEPIFSMFYQIKSTNIYPL